MAKVKVKFKTGTEALVYEHEKYHLYKKGLIEVNKKDSTKYDDMIKDEKPTKQNVALQGSQFDRVNIKISDLETEILKLLERVEKLEKLNVKPGPSETK